MRTRIVSVLEPQYLDEHSGARLYRQLCNRCHVSRTRDVNSTPLEPFHAGRRAPRRTFDVSEPVNKSSLLWTYWR